MRSGRGEIRGARARRSERGSALLVTVMMLVLLGLIGIAALDTVTQDRRSAGFETRSKAAFYAAEAGVSTARNLVRQSAKTATPPLPVTPLGSAALYAKYGGRQPSYQGDPNAGASPIKYLGTGGVASGMNLGDEGGNYRWAIWRVQVQGQTGDGAASRIDAMLRAPGDGGY